MTQYTTAKIYKIVDNTNNNVYYGSTTKTLEHRLRLHLSNYKQFLKGKINFRTSFMILKNNDYAIHLVENYPCNNNKELQLRESFYIQNNECVNFSMTDKINKVYHAEWLDKIEIAKQYTNRKSTCACGGTYTASHKSQHSKSKKHITYITIQNLTVLNLTVSNQNL